MTILRAKSLTTFSVTPDGANIAIGVADEEGRAGALMLPTDCLRGLMMTLPEIMRRALRLQHDDPGLRLVYRTAPGDKAGGRFVSNIAKIEVRDSTTGH
jgi:hypothetical protein